MYLYHTARNHPENFYLGVDCNARPLEKISERIFRKPDKGGASNLLYLLSSVESLPEELNGISNEILILFPWGSLLRSVACGQTEVLQGLKSISAASASLKIVIGFDPQTDKNELQRLGIPPLSLEYIHQTLVPLYQNAGFKLQTAELLTEQDWEKLKTSWAQRLRQNPARSVFQLLFTL